MTYVVLTEAGEQYYQQTKNCIVNTGKLEIIHGLHFNQPRDKRNYSFIEPHNSGYTYEPYLKEGLVKEVE